MGKAKDKLGVIDDQTPAGRWYTLDGVGLPESAQLVSVSDAKVTLRDDQGEDIVLSRDEWEQTWAPCVESIEDPPEDAAPATETPLPGTQEDLIQGVIGGSLVMIPRDLMDSATSAKADLDERTAHFKEMAEQRRQAKDDMEAAQDHYNKVSNQILGHASRTGFPAGSPLAQLVENQE